MKNDCDEANEIAKDQETDGQGKTANNKNSETEIDDKEWQVIGAKNKGSIMRTTDFEKTPISDIFGGLLKSKIHRTGDHVTENIQPFFTLQLNIEVRNLQYMYACKMCDFQKCISIHYSIIRIIMKRQI